MMIINHNYYSKSIINDNDNYVEYRKISSVNES